VPQFMKGQRFRLGFLACLGHQAIGISLAPGLAQVGTVTALGAGPKEYEFLNIPSCGQPLPGAIYGTVEIVPDSLDADVGLVHMPVAMGGLEVPAEAAVKLWGIGLNPAVDGARIDLDPSHYLKNASLK